MLKDEEFEELVDGLKLGPAGRDFISDIRASPPARLVGEASKHNLSGQIFSEKMGCLIQYESRTGEAVFALNAEYDDEVLEFYDQPVRITLLITDKRGHRNRTTCTPDYVVLRRTGVTFYEIKPRKELKKRVGQRPVDWSEEDGRFRYAPAETAFRDLGFDYQIVASDDLSQRRAHNIRLLLNARKVDLRGNDLKNLDKLVAHVEKYGPLPMDRALAAMDLQAATLAIVGIDRHLLVADIDRALLSRPSTVWLATNKEDLSSITALTKGRLGEELSVGVILQTDFPRPGEHHRIIDRLAMIKGDKASNMHPSTVRRWKVRLAKAANNPIALASHYAKCGTRGPRIHPDHHRYILEFHARTFGTEEARTLRAVYREYWTTLEGTPSWTTAWGPPVKWETYRNYVSHMDQEDLEQKRGGLAAGNAAARPVDPQLVGLPCQYAFEVAEIDHYLADLFVVVAKTKRKIYCARPWITLMIDVFSGCVLAMWIGLSAPSRRSCAMVIRDCIRRHGRIPNCLRLDNGSEFHSVYLDMLIAYLGITKEHRPSRDAKYASEVERSFKTVRTKFLDDQPGHLLNNARGREVAAAFKGEAQAALDIAHFVEFSEDFVFNDFNGHPRGNNVSAPAVLLEESIEAIGVGGVPVALNAALMVATAIEAPSASYEISYLDGIRVSDARYRSAELTAMLSRGTKRVEIRLEPYDDSFIYVYDRDRDRWHIAQKRSAVPTLTSADARPNFDALLRAEGTLILKGVKQDRDRYYVQKRDEWKKVLQADGIEFLDMTEMPPEKESPSKVAKDNPPSSPRTRSIPSFVGFT